MSVNQHTFEIPAPPIQIHLCRWRQITEWEHGNMAAPFWRLYWNRTSGAWIERDGQRVDLVPSRWTLVSPGPPLRTGNRKPFSHFFIHFSIDPDRGLNQPLIQQGSMSASERSALHSMIGQGLDGQVPSRQFAHHCLHRIHASLAAIHESLWNPIVTDFRIRTALKRIHAQVRRPVDVAALAESISLHPKSFTRLFKQTMGVAPYHYGLCKRLDGAASDLIHTRASVEQIAEAWGFSDRYHLTKLMKRYRSSTPGRLRQVDLN